MSAIISEPGSTLVIARRRRTDVSWGAIFAGWLLAYGVAWLLYLLGSAIGFTALGMTEENIAQGLGWSTVVWIIVTWAASMFAGGLFAAWLRGNADRTNDAINGALHGAAVWALATMLGLVLAGLTAVNVLQAGQSMLPGASLGQMVLQGGEDIAAQGSGGSVMTALQAELKQALSEAAARAAQNAPMGGAAVSPDEVRRAIDQLRPATLAAIAGQMVRGDTEAATNTLVVNTPLSRAEVDQIVQGMSATAEQLQQRAQAAADQAAEYSAAALWTLFASSALGLAMAVWGGWLGARRFMRSSTSGEGRE